MDIKAPFTIDDWSGKLPFYLYKTMNTIYLATVLKFVVGWMQRKQMYNFWSNGSGRCNSVFWSNGSDRCNSVLMG